MEETKVLTEDAKIKMGMLLVQNFLMQFVFLLIDSAIAWFVWRFVAVSSFNAPQLSPWQILGVIYMIKVLTRKRN